jgi:hypothetical protein
MLEMDGQSAAGGSHHRERRYGSAPVAPVPIAMSAPLSSAAHVPVRTEFVFAATRKHRAVHLCGDWCNWEPIKMHAERG